MQATMRPRTIFFGSPEFAVPSLERVASDTELVAVVTQPDRPAGRGRELVAPAVKVAAGRLAPGVPVLQPEKIRTGDFEAALRALDAALFVVVAYGRILPQSILDLPALGPFNVHASLLPRGRGAAPIQWSIINGDEKTGISIMRMEAGLDTGPVVARAEIAIFEDDTAETLGARLAVLGADLLGATLPAILEGRATFERQEDARATLAPILRKEDGRLSFAASARAVSARARGVDPWPGATALLVGGGGGAAGGHGQGAPSEGPIVKLFRPRVIAPGLAGTSVSTPGTIVAIDDVAGVVVACGDGAVAFAELQLPGRKRLPARAAAAGRAISVGMRLE
jgi:methionyl-tRNA formyltransferase